MKWAVVVAGVVLGCGSAVVDQDSPAPGHGGEGAVGVASGGEDEASGAGVGESGGRGGASGAGGRWPGAKCHAPPADDGAAGDAPQREPAGGCNEAVIAAAERAVNPDHVVVDEALIVAHGFDLSASLCPRGNWPPHREEPEAGGASLSSFFVRVDSFGGLELVTSTGDSGERRVQVTPLHRSSLGWDAARVQTCARLDYSIEDTFLTNRHAASAMHLVFHRPEPGAELQASVAVEDAERPIVSGATRDRTAPSYLQQEYSSLHLGSDDYYPVAFREDFVFSEPLGPDTTIAVTDEHGKPVQVTLEASQGYPVAFRFNDAIAGQIAVALTLVDVNGNEREDSFSLTGVEFAPTSGDFEVQVDALDPADWKVHDDYSRCRDAEALTSPSEAQWPSVDVPPLAGEKSFFFGEVDYSCAMSFRLQPSSGTSHVVFDARRIGSWPYVNEPVLEVCVSSLGAGGDRSCSEQVVPWVDDPEYGDAATHVSQRQSVSFPFPDNVTDALVTIRSADLLWLDSLRVE